MVRVAYLVNQYPAVSHSFIRREIVALENLGIEVFRFSIRSLASELVDEADKKELEKTKFILNIGIVGLLANLVSTALTRPLRFFQALSLVWKVGWRKDKGILVHLAYLAEACVLLRWVSSLELDCIHAHFAFNPTTVAMLCHALGGPKYSFTIHGPESIDRAVVLSLGEKVKRANFVAGISSYTIGQLYRWCDYQYWQKIHLVRCGLDEPYLAQDLTSVPKNLQLVCVARLSEQKGHLILLKAVRNLVLEGLDLKLILVGDGPLRSKLENLIIQFNLQNHVKITGWVDNQQVKNYILDSQLMVLASFAEGLPVVLMESLALGRPAISTYIAGIPELIEYAGGGFLIPSGSVADLTSAIRNTIQIPQDQLNAIAKLGAEKVSKNHNVNTEAKILESLFKGK